MFPDASTLIQILIYGLTDGAVVALNAAGFTLAYSVARQINLAHGSVFALTTVVIANLASFVGVTAAAPLILRMVTLVLFSLAGAVCGGVLNVDWMRLTPYAGSGNYLSRIFAKLHLVDRTEAAVQARRAGLGH